MGRCISGVESAFLFGDSAFLSAISFFSAKEANFIIIIVLGGGEGDKKEKKEKKNHTRVMIMMIILRSGIECSGDCKEGWDRKYLPRW